jgi:hypothetical protein
MEEVHTSRVGRTAREDYPLLGDWTADDAAKAMDEIDRLRSDLAEAEALAARTTRTPIDWGAAPEDVDPNEDGIGYS